MKTVIENYKDFLDNADFEVIHTPKLGWIILRTDYQKYSNPVIPIHSPKELICYIEMQK